MTKEIIRCSIPGCNSTALSLVNFYSFPHDENDRKNWLNIIGCPMLFELRVEDLLSNHFVCSQHFESKDPEADTADNITENLLISSEEFKSDVSLQQCSNMASSLIQDTYVDEKNTTTSYCICGHFFVSFEDFNLHIQNDCPLLLRESNGDEASYMVISNNDGRMRENIEPRKGATNNNAIPKCKECGKTFSTAIRLQYHMSQHTGHRPFECGICGNTFVEKACLKTHMTMIHTDKKEFRCDICNKIFNSLSYLKTHRLRHEKVKNFKCGICPHVAFFDNQELKMHMRKHTKDKPFKCTVCFKQFSQGSHLITHMRIHNDEKPFECLICHKVFRQVSNLNQHKKIHH